MANKLAASVEVLATSIVGNLNDADLKEFTANPQATIEAKMNADTSAFKISVVENSANEIHLGLPYYAFVDGSQAKSVVDSSLDNVAGGEIALSILAVLGIVGAVAATGTATALAIAGPPTAVAVGIAAGVKASEGKKLDDSKK